MGDPTGTDTTRIDHAAALQALLAWLWPALEDLPPEVERRAKRLWTDTAACAFSGLRSPEMRDWMGHVSRRDPGPVPLPGSSQGTGVAAAATAMAVSACWDEACEGLALAHGRPGVPVVAALWALLPSSGASWGTLWQATAAGYEVAARLGASLRIPPGMHVDGAWSAFGAAVAAVRLHGGSPGQAMAAIEAAACQLPYSLLRPARQGANIRNLFLGHGAWLGLQAFQAVEAGWQVASGAVDDFAATALRNAPAGTWHPAGRWLVLDSYWKPHAAVRHVHYGIEAALALRQRGLTPDTIERVHLTVYPEALHYCANRAPTTPLAAQFSLSFGLAAALLFGEVAPSVYRPPRFDDSRLQALERLVTIDADAERGDGARGAVLDVFAGGRRWRHVQHAIVGDPGMPPDDSLVRAKFARDTEGDATMAAWSERLHRQPAEALAGLPH